MANPGSIDGSSSHYKNVKGYAIVSGLILGLVVTAISTGFLQGSNPEVNESGKPVAANIINGIDILVAVAFLFSILSEKSKWRIVESIWWIVLEYSTGSFLAASSLAQAGLFPFLRSLY